MTKTLKLSAKIDSGIAEKDDHLQGAGIRLVKPPTVSAMGMRIPGMEAGVHRLSPSMQMGNTAEECEDSRGLLDTTQRYQRPVTPTKELHIP